MVLLHIDEKNVGAIKKVDDFLRNKKVFILIYMTGCGPCNATRPEWEKLENVLTKEFINRSAKELGFSIKWKGRKFNEKGYVKRIVDHATERLESLARLEEIKTT